MQTTDIIDDVMLQLSLFSKTLGEYMEQSKLKCCDCEHSKVSWFNKLIRNEYGYNCTKYTIPGKYDPVCGKTTPEKIGPCSTARLDRMFCGPRALLWKPKDDRRLFDYIKHLDDISKDDNESD